MASLPDDVFLVIRRDLRDALDTVRLSSHAVHFSVAARWIQSHVCVVYHKVRCWMKEQKPCNTFLYLSTPDGTV